LDPTDVEQVLQRIARAQEDAARGFEPDVSGRAGGKEGIPRLARPEAVVDWERFDRLLPEVLTILGEWSGESAPGEAAGVRVPPGRRTELAAAAKEDGAELGAMAEELGEDPARFALAVRYALAPFFRRFAESLAREADLEEFLGQRCPVCGGEPRMAELSAEEGRRRLFCGLCGTLWRFQRIRCPFCGIEDQAKLGVLEADGLEGYRVDVCDACGRYIKTVDRRRLAEPRSLELADALTPELDQAAAGAGYGLRASRGPG
jgi:FdhE protein